jgi:hypothetical protein
MQEALHSSLCHSISAMREIRVALHSWVLARRPTVTIGWRQPLWLAFVPSKFSAAANAASESATPFGFGL